MKRWLISSAAALWTGCASMFLHGGTLVDRGYDAPVLVAYRIEGTAPKGVQYFLVKQQDGARGAVRAIGGWQRHAHRQPLARRRRGSLLLLGRHAARVRVCHPRRSEQTRQEVR